MHITIDPTRSLPIYQQIVEHIAGDINSGALAVGAKLPTVRALAIENDLSVGTVRQAYDALVRRGLLVMHQGRGTFVRPLSPGRINHAQNPTTEAGQTNRKQRALEAIDRALGEILALGLGPREARIFFDLRLRELESVGPVIKVGVIDCNPEALIEIKHQLAPLPSVEVFTYLMDDIAKNPEQLEADLDLFVITTTHIAQLTDKLDQSIPLAAVVMIFSPDTVAEIAQRSKNASFGILCKSPRFSGLISRVIHRYAKTDHPPETFLFGENITELNHFLQKIDTLILPTAWMELCSPEERNIISAAHQKQIMFHFEMDQGSMLSLTNQVQQMLHNRLEQ